MKVILTVFLMMVASCRLQTLTTNSYISGQAATYTWTILISGPSFWMPHFPLQLYFPSGSVISSDSIVTINGAVQSFTYYNYPSPYINITSAISVNTFSVIVTKIINPYLGGYYYYRNPSDSVSNSLYLSFYNSFNYYSGSGTSGQKMMRMFFIGTIISLAWIGFIIFYRYYRSAAAIYVPYAIIFFTSIFQIFLLALNLFLQNTSLLNYDQQWSSKITASRALFGLGFGFIVLRNFVYLYTFCREIVPLFENRRQINYFVTILIGVIASFSSFEFGYLLYSKMSLTVFVPVRQQGQLLSMNRFSKFTLIINFILIVGCILGILNAMNYFLHIMVQNGFLLLADLLGIVLINSIVTIIFLVRDKPQEYFVRNQIIIVNNTIIDASNFNLGNLDQTKQQIVPASVIQKLNDKISAPQIDQRHIQEIKMEQLTKQSEQIYKWRVLSIDF